MPVQFLTQLGTVIRFVAEHAFGSPPSADQAIGDRTIVRFASGQQDGDQASFNICECVDFRVAPSARAANSLLLLPPFPPAADRRVFPAGGSISSVSLS